MQDQLREFVSQEPVPSKAETVIDNIEAMRVELQQQILDLLKEDEKAVFQLWIEGERQTAVFARTLGISENTSEEETRKSVQKVKNRLRKRLRRDKQIKQWAAPLKSAWKEVREMGLRP